MLSETMSLTRTLWDAAKKSQEEIVGMVKRWKSYLSETRSLSKGMAKTSRRDLRRDHSRARRHHLIFHTDVANHVPHMKISWDQKVVLTVQDAVNALRNGNPPSCSIRPKPHCP